MVVYGTLAGADGNFVISVTDFVNPPNDYCDQAEPLTINAPEVIGFAVNATTRTPYGCSGSHKQAPEFYYIVAGNGEELTARTCSSNMDFETSLYTC